MKKYAVFGNPIKHSLSPLIHHYFAKNLNINLIYKPILGTLGKFEKEAEEFLQQGGSGFNITLPFKQDAFKFSKINTESAKITKSVNTIFLKDGVVCGANTDGVGFIRDLKINIKYDIKNKNILLVGAGGAAMGIIPSILSEYPSSLKIYNRTYEKALNLCNDFKNLGPISIIKENYLEKEKFDLLINTTSLGINNVKFELPRGIFNKDAICYDLSYGKASHSVSSWAKKNNILFYDGLGMLLEQAADSFFIWEGKKPLVTESLRKILLEKL